MRRSRPSRGAGARPRHVVPASREHRPWHRSFAAGARGAQPSDGRSRWRAARSSLPPATNTGADSRGTPVTQNPLLSDDDVAFLLHDVHRIDELCSWPAFADHTPADLDLLIGAARRLA